MDKNVDVVDIFLVMYVLYQIWNYCHIEKVGDGAPLLSVLPTTKDEFFKKIGDKIQQGQMIMPCYPIVIISLVG
jgi:hypothetical protein